MRFRKTVVASFAAVLLFAHVAVAQTSQPKHALDVPYVPTTEEAVKAMLKLADVKQSDIVYDLGCGDGRIVIAAAKEYGAQVGIDINPETPRKLVSRNWCVSKKTIYSRPTSTKPQWLRYFC